MERAQALPGPSCINIMTDPDIVHPVTPIMVGDVNAEGEIAIPYYENIPID
jgi:acetolactate synthase-1/2/3 large subunit